MGLTLGVSAQQEGAALEVKWHPGHYLTLSWGEPREDWSKIAGQPGFVGGQRIYMWADLEPQKGRYDFSGIDADLAYLRAQGQYLVLEVWDNTFLKGQKALSDYLLSPEYSGGIAYPEPPPGKVSYVTRAKRWVPAVMDRYLLLVEALGKRYDGAPNFAGLVHTETAMEMKGQGFEDFSSAGYDEQTRRMVVASRQAFSHTPVLVYGNWYPYKGPTGLGELAELARQHGVGWGGPDLVPGKNIWGVDIIRANAGKMPLGLAAQWDSYKGQWTARELLDFAVHDLKLNFVFWGNYERKATGGLSLTQDVIPAVALYPDSLAMDRPANLAVTTDGRGQ